MSTRIVAHLGAAALCFSAVKPVHGQAACATPIAVPSTFPVRIPFVLRGNHVAIVVCRGNRPLNFVLDTGAGTSIFDLNTAKSMGIETTSAYRANGGGGGSSAAGRVRRDSVTIDGVGINVPIESAIDFSALAGPEGTDLQGILGADFLSRFIVAIDYRNLELRLFDKTAFTYTGVGTTVPIRIVGAFIRVNGEITLADGAHIPGDFVVDVGSGLALALAKPFVESNRLRERLPNTVYRPGGRGVGGLTMADIGRVETLSIGSVTVDRPVTHLYGDNAGVFSSNALGDGNIGSDVLRRFTVYFDYAGRRMIFEPHDRTKEPFESDMSGLQLTAMPGGHTLRADFVLEKSPAGLAGMAVGDIIVAVDGKPVTATTLPELRLRWRKEGDRNRLTINRPSGEVGVEFTTKRIV